MLYQIYNSVVSGIVLWIFWRSNFENTSYITRENQSYSFCKSTKICIAYTDAFTLMISFVFSSLIINEFHNVVYYSILQVASVGSRVVL